MQLHIHGQDACFWCQSSYISIFTVAYWLFVCSKPSHYLSLNCHIVNQTFRNKLQWNFNRITIILILESLLENVVSTMSGTIASDILTSIWSEMGLLRGDTKPLYGPIKFVSTRLNRFSAEMLFVSLGFHGSHGCGLYVQETLPYATGYLPE